MSQLPQRVLFGAAYYHEYQPYERLKDDLDLMAEAHFNVIRLGESVWSTWEPDNGHFDLDWLQPVLDGAHERGMAVILGTPTYAIPPWLARQYPEIAGERGTGQRIGWGSRQEVDYTHPAFRFHAERVIRKVVARYAEHPAVIGFQVDNEPGLELFHNHGVFQRFVDHLRHTYGDVDTLNREWGLTYWSHRLSTWADLWTPDGNSQPQYDLAWRRFQAALTTEFIEWQADIVRAYASPDQFVTTCIAYDRPAIEDDALTRTLDVTAGNPYYPMQDSLALPNPHPTRQAAAANEGTWALYRIADRIYASRQEPFLVTETNAQSIGPSWRNQSAYDGQWRQAAWALVARGASMIEYWHWHTLHFGTETYVGGILPHSGRPGRIYHELAALGAELETAGDLVAALTPDADVAFLYSLPSKWALEAQPALATPDGSADARSHATVFDAFYRGAFDAGLQARLVHPGQLETVDLPPLLVAPAFYAADDATLDRLLAYAESGRHLVIGPRTGYADHEARARTDVQPARLAGPAGVSYDEYTNLDTAVEVQGSTELPLSAQAQALYWADALVPDGADVLATYNDPHLGRWPAATTRPYGTGRITYIGTVPNPAFGEALFNWAAPQGAWGRPHPSVTATSATARDGRRVRFLHNWSWNPVSVTLPAAAKDALTPTVYEAGGSVELGPWDVKVLTERG
ncbi:beta-galactosidase [Streptomyces sp. NPDC001315]|uniref:beta-galactosidase n=1 Tax=Streptomyces sp. NPDC001315 TaxID=3364562 RepID=UPI00368760BC